MNSLKSGETLTLSNDLFNTLVVSQLIFTKSQKLFNPAIGLWSKKWKASRGMFQTKVRENYLIPNFRMLKLDIETNKAFFKKEPFRVDLGGIAKGTILDSLKNILLMYGCQSYMISLGGEMQIGSPPPNSKNWKIHLEGPDRKISKTIFLKNTAFSASGSSYQFYYRNGEIVSHIYNPRTKKSINSPHIAYVKNDSSEIADAWATVLNILGPEGFKLLEKEKIKGGLLNNKGWIIKNF